MSFRNLVLGLGILGCVVSGGDVTARGNERGKDTRPDINTETYGQVGDSYRLDPDRTVELVGFVGFNAVQAAGKVVVLLNSRKPIDLVINSPGGSVSAGETLMLALDGARSIGIEVNCIVIGASYSMGFNVLGSCSHIYATPAASFLFHPVRATVSEPMRALDAIQLAKELQKVDTKYLGIAQKVTNLPQDVVAKAYYAEKFWSRQEFTSAGYEFFTPVKVVYNLRKEAMEYPNREMFERNKRQEIERNKRNRKIILEN